MNLVNVSAVVVHRAWDAGIYVTNLTNKQAIQEPPAQPNALSNLTNDTMVNLPREIDLRVGYSFGSQQQE